MLKNNFVSIVYVLFLIIGIMHGLRIFNGWEVQIGNLMIPIWASYVTMILAFYLSFQGFRLVKK